jgi:hypothetical protein
MEKSDQLVDSDFMATISTEGSYYQINQCVISGRIQPMFMVAMEPQEVSRKEYTYWAKTNERWPRHIQLCFFVFLSTPCGRLIR